MFRFVRLQKLRALIFLFFFFVLKEKISYLPVSKCMSFSKDFVSINYVKLKDKYILLNSIDI